MHFSLLVIAIIDRFTATGALWHNCLCFFCTSTLESLFILFLGLKAKMWNVIDTWIILESHNFLRSSPNRISFFDFLQRNHNDATTVDNWWTVKYICTSNQTL